MDNSTVLSRMLAARVGSEPRVARRRAFRVTRRLALTGFVFSLTLLSVGALSGCSSVPQQSSGRRGLLQAMGDPWNGVVGARRSYPRASSPAVAELRQLEGVRQKTHTWMWPLEQVEVTSRFGNRDGDAHEGVDLKAASGTPVYAAQAGKVIYSDSKVSGYGKMVVLKHTNGLSTVYAHNSRLLARKGQWVSQGHVIALSGATGRASGPHVHFEVRDGAEAIDPMRVLPDRNARPILAARRLAANTSSATRPASYRVAANEARTRPEGNSRRRTLARRGAARIEHVRQTSAAPVRTERLSRRSNAKPRYAIPTRSGP